MCDIGTGSDCTICVTNNGDIANVDRSDFDSLSESDNNNGDVDHYMISY